jgi:predicted DNA-binding transcriptional regulator AlpA
MNKGSVFDADDRLLKIRECLKIVPVAQSTWWERVKDGQLPKPVKIGGNTFWRYSDLMKVVRGDWVHQ